MSSNVSELLNQRVNSILNDSTTKHAYSFGHAIRFKPNSIKDNFYHFYKLPEIRSNRGTTLGYGKKCNYSQIVGCGSNQLYAAPSYFDPKKNDSPAYSFGREIRLKKIKDLSPGPKYLPPINLEKGIPSTIFGKEGLNTSKHLRKNYSFLGPGAYFNEKHHELSTSFSSNLANSVNLIIGREKRFRKLFKDITPGPGRYNIPSLINVTGIINNSKYISSPARSFIGMKNIRLVKKKDLTPGPGQYNFFSIFEGYSKNKNLMQNKKTIQKIKIKKN